MISTLYIHQHLGLGDHIFGNGMIRYILKMSDYDVIGLFAKSNYFDMVDYMYRDDVNIKVIEVDGNNEYGGVRDYLSENLDFKSHFLRVGHEHYHPNPNKCCAELFYEQVNVPFIHRYDSFYFERDIQEEQRVFDKLNPKNEPFVFIHDDPSRGFKIDRSYLANSNLKIVENDPTENIFYFIKIIEEAKEIHAMESSFRLLIETYDRSNNIFYHDFRGHPIGNTMDVKEWKVISYE
jgi:hypothetical protein